ncbi:MAG: hypothetical protein Q8P56_01680 [Candidatus Uhrbacteria bacterium]|nr:hypothetical protein [Candidatus Uhrbacteria bacterium]
MKDKKETHLFKMIKKDIHTVGTAKEWRVFIDAAKRILVTVQEWDSLDEVLTEDGREKIQSFAVGLLQDAQSTQTTIPLNERDGARSLSLRLMDALKNSDMSEVAGTFFILSFHYLVDVFLPDRSNDIEAIDPQTDLAPLLPPCLLFPFTLLGDAVFAPFVKNALSLSEKEKNEYGMLVFVLFMKITEGLMIDGICKTKNANRSTRVKEFCDHGRLGVSPYYSLLENQLQIRQLKKALRKIIDRDPYFFSPYSMLIDIAEDEDDYNTADMLLRQGASKALFRIVDKDGNWPEYIPWGVVDNRHLVLMLDRWAYMLWKDGYNEYAADMYRKLFASNPHDNVGARYSLLAILLGYDPEWMEDEFPSSTPGYTDAIKQDDWFRAHIREYPEEFEWWTKFSHKEEEG